MPNGYLHPQGQVPLYKARNEFRNKPRTRFPRLRTVDEMSLRSKRPPRRPSNLRSLFKLSISGADCLCHHWDRRRSSMSYLNSKYLQLMCMFICIRRSSLERILAAQPHFISSSSQDQGRRRRHPGSGQGNYLECHRAATCRLVPSQVK